MRYIINKKPEKQPNMFWYWLWLDLVVLALFIWDCWITMQYLLLQCSN